MRATKIGNIVPGGQYVAHICANCGETFVLPCAADVYPMRLDKKFFCRYSCLRNYEKTHDIRPNIKRDYLV